MKITERDKELMGWILEQGFMTVEQLRRVFWKGITSNSGEAHKRLKELQNAGFLKTDDSRIYRPLIYMVSRQGVKELRAYGRNQGLGELQEVGHTTFLHDLEVTDVRALFHELGYKGWLSERVLSKFYDLRRIPDGMIFHEDKYIAIEYESSQKARERYESIFQDYELEEQVNKVLYITNTRGLLSKISKEAATRNKPHFVLLEDLQKDLTNAKLIKHTADFTLHEFFHFDFKA